MEEVLKNPTFVLFAILCLGLALGNIQIKGVSLGSSGVLFVALLAGHFKLTVPDGVTGIGTAMFVYCVGLGVGNRFFSSLLSKGSKLTLLSILVVGVACLTAYLLCLAFGVDGAVAAGLFAGACTSTPGLAAASEAVQSLGLDASGLNIGYGVAYPFGVIGVVLFVQLLPRLLKTSIDEQPAEKATAKDPEQIIRRVVCVTNAEMFGKNVLNTQIESKFSSRITRVVEAGILMPLEAETVFKEGMSILMVGRREDVTREANIIGHVDLKVKHPRAFSDERAEVILLSREMSNKSLLELNTLDTYGIVVSRITRLGVTFIPTAETELLRNDVLHVVGAPEDIQKFMKVCKHRCTAINATDILSLAGGIALGILVGKVSLSLGNGEGFSLGMAGGPLVVALILGHFGKIGPIAGFIPRPTRVLLMELALMFFLAGAGVKGGEKLVETLQEQGIAMFLIGVTITIIPLIIGYIFARKVLKMSLPEALGGICGSMTSTPALGAITAKTDRQEPVIAYATAYPAALILMAVLAKLLISIL